MLTILLATLAAVQSPASTELSEARCGYVVTSAGPGAPLIEAPDLHVLEQTAGDGAFSPAVPAEAAIVCDRSSIVPATNDWKVPDSGHPLYIGSREGLSERMGVLEMAGGGLRYRLLLGAWTRDEEIQVDERLAAFRRHAR
jgi:hypothetical protein